VDGRALLGVITAVYDNEPYAHMIPITSILSGIQSMFGGDPMRTKVKVVSHGQIEARRRDVSKDWPKPMVSVGHVTSMKKSIDYYRISELLSILLNLIVIGLVSLPD
jgi:hypothetical protein